MLTTAAIAKELLKGGSSPTAEALVKLNHSKSQPPSSLKPQSQSQGVRPKDQLMYLAQLLDFQVHFTDFPKVGFMTANFINHFNEKYIWDR